MNNKRIGYYQGSTKENNVISFLKKHAENNSNKIIFQTNDTQTSYKDFYTSVQRVANGLKKNDIKKGDYIILLAPMTQELYLILFALNYVGAIPVFLESFDNIKNHIQSTQPKAIISTQDIFNALKTQLPKENNLIHISIDKSCKCNLGNLINNDILKEISTVTQEHTALLTFTTGSSGRPKGVQRSHQFLSAQHYALSRIIPYDNKAIDLPTFPIFALNNIASGITTILPNFSITEKEFVIAKKIIDQFHQYQINYTTVSPMIFNAIANYCNDHNLKLPKIKRVITGGAPLSQDNLLKFQKIAHPSTEILVLYGSTEVEPITCITAEETLSLNQKSIDGSNVGKVDKHLAYKIIKPIDDAINIQSNKDWDNLQLPKGTPGELIVSGEHVCKAYFKNDKAFRSTKIIDTDQTIWHRTGDIVKMDSENRLVILGRKHNIIKHKTGVIYPIVVEAVIKKIPFVQDAAVVEITNKNLKRKIIIAITLNSNNKKIKVEKNIQEQSLKLNIPLDSIVFLNKIPRDHRMHSKVDYTALAKLIMAHDATK